MRDPRVGMVSVNDVRVTKDLAYADIYVSALGADEVDGDLRAYVNRLSDFLFVAARAVNHRAGVPELEW